MSVRAEHITIQRSARIFLLGTSQQIDDLWIVCHGYGQLPGRWLHEFEPIGAAGRLIVAPEGLHRFYLDPTAVPASKRRVGVSWMTREDRETDIKDYVSYLDRVVDHVLPAGKDVRVRALGFSQGCATVCRWAALGATSLNDLVLWAGEVPYDLDMQPAVQRLRQTRIVLASGTQDDTVPQQVQRRNHELLDAAGLSYEVHEYEGGHHLDAALLAALV